MIESWQVMEKELARKLKGLLTPGSGNKSVKGDVHCDLFVVEAKWRGFQYNDEYYLTLEKDWLLTIGRHADRYGKQPLLAVCIANLATYYLMDYGYWKECEGRTELIEPDRIDLRGKKQLRMYAKDNFAYKVFDFDDAGEWIALPESDLLFIVKLARRSLGEEDKCEKKKTQRSWTRSTRPKTAEQIQREVDWKAKQKAFRKELYEKRKQRRKSQV